MAAIYAIANQKGGVGKTTTAINLGACLSARGRRVLLVDADPQANTTSGLGFDKRQVGLSIYDVLVGDLPLTSAVQVTRRLGLDLVPSSLPLAGAEVELVELPGREKRLAQALRGIKGRYDCVMIDCPPSLGLLTINALAAARGVIVPIQCEYLALEGLSQLMQTIRLVHDNLNPALHLVGVVMTMFDPRVNLSLQVVQEVQRHFPREIFRTIIPRSIRLSEAPSYGQTILEYDPTSRGAVAYQNLAEEVLSRETDLRIEAGHQREYAS
ncbi:MAG: ParA family protein [Chloroflexota bacterium]